MLTSSRLLCFCRLAESVEVPEISLCCVDWVCSSFGRGILEGLFSKGGAPRLLGVPRYVFPAPDMMVSSWHCAVEERTQRLSQQVCCKMRAL